MLNSNECLLDVSDLSVFYVLDRGTVKAVDEVSFKIREGESLGIVGESGSGKSTLASAILRLVPQPGKIVSGKVLYKGQNMLEFSNAKMREIRGCKIAT